MEEIKSEIASQARFRQIKSLVLLFFASFFAAYVLPDDPRLMEAYSIWGRYLYLYGIMLLAMGWLLLIYQTLFESRGRRFESLERKLDRYDEDVFLKFSFMKSRFGIYLDTCAVMAILTDLAFMASSFFADSRF